MKHVYTILISAVIVVAGVAMALSLRTAQSEPLSTPVGGDTLITEKKPIIITPLKESVLIGKETLTPVAYEEKKTALLQKYEAVEAKEVSGFTPDEAQELIDTINLELSRRGYVLNDVAGDPLQEVIRIISE